MLANFQRDALVNAIAGKDNVNGAIPSQYYIGLLKEIPVADQSTPPAEVSTVNTNYSRMVVGNNKTVFSPAVNGVVSTVSELSWLPVGEAGYGNVVAVAMFATQTGGLPMYVSVLATPKTYDKDDIPFFLPGGIRFTVQDAVD